ncbi:NAD(P)H-dependent flavin oxidoreductase [Solimicrobium silvestre]|uniref:Dioxygenases related to 2-nitropropane dioxygenase n=1 Tax=Solimicrobium silvestre TaxID=2099400 RepID=A0A2S9GT40_9BURK|nr:nitronate monooxygenase [Solimicrobium silvestre]PRC90875.1 Dioxygenases related to 2-nitropropane dioxygenase [Solimicrobium silvestre]
MSIPQILKDGLQLPVIAAPMFLVSGTRLVIETCKQGIIGTLPALNARPSSQLDDWLFEIQTALADIQAAKFGVMLPIHKSNKRLEEDLDIVIRHKVPLVITAAGHRPDVIEAVHSYGGVVFHDAIHMKHAMKAVEAGVDGIIPICAGGGGNAGILNPFTFVTQLRAEFDGTIVLGGAMGHGRHIRAAQVLGADIAYMGTRFIATEEANANPKFKQMILDAESTDVIYTNKVTGIGASFLRESLEKAGLDWREGAVIPPVTVENEEEMIAWRDIWSAGHGVGLIQDVPTVAHLAQRLKDEYSAALAL